MKLSKILKIMKFALKNPEQYEESYIIKKFGEKSYGQFSQYCLGGNAGLAHYLDQKLKLTQIGVREYHRLKNQRQAKIATRILAIATIALAIITWYK